MLIMNRRKLVYLQSSSSVLFLRFISNTIHNWLKIVIQIWHKQAQFLTYTQHKQIIRFSCIIQTQVPTCCNKLEHLAFGSSCHLQLIWHKKKQFYKKLQHMIMYNNCLPFLEDMSKKGGGSFQYTIIIHLVTFTTSSNQYKIT